MTEIPLKKKNVTSLVYDFEVRVAIVQYCDFQSRYMKLVSYISKYLKILRIKEEMLPIQCSVFGCSQRQSKQSNVSFFRFPKHIFS